MEETLQNVVLLAKDLDHTIIITLIITIIITYFSGGKELIFIFALLSTHNRDST